ncbi:MAG: Crossover junction endonuclease mus81 [Candelina submexicana]|nr:MAG: Crossover junction endonuclease mus81 [Candelina submexicana]
MANDCANPLLLQWIGEWLETARERNTKGVTVYKKAYDSMKACPLAFDHPSQAQQLHGLGPKLCDRLAERLKAHCIENGLPAPELLHRAQKRPVEAPAAEAAPSKRTRKPKPYVPALRSGPYAIILALSSVHEDSVQGFTKAQTIELAQEHCEASFTAPSDPTKFYTAWNSMKTLIGKDLVYERGRPLRKYALTDNGWEVAKRINKTAGGGLSGSAKPGMSNQQTYRNPEIHSHLTIAPQRRESDKEDIISRHASRKQLGIADHQSNPSSCAGWPDTGSDSDEKGFSSNRCGTRPLGRAVLSCDSLAKEESQNLLSRSTSPLTLKRGVNAISRAKAGNGASLNGAITSKDQGSDIIELLSSTPAPSDVQESAKDAELSVRPSIARSGNKGAASRPAVSIHQSGPPGAKPEPFASFQPIQILPSTFSVQLVLDNREIRAKTDRDYIQEELMKKGIKPIMRSLELGDALWVAKCNDLEVLGRHGEEGDEVVLDWIVERKRLDDLVGSIKDGRFHEQKFRLRKSGVKNVVYIIEEISMKQEAIGKYEEAVASAIASTQVVNGYFVKKTQKIDDTIRYLARMTLVLKGLYESKSLNIIPTPSLTPQNYLPLLGHLRNTRPSTCYQITYSAFASLSSKSDFLTLRDIYLKMLMCTRGITGDKALEIQKYWKTPRNFIEAFERCSTEKERNNLLIQKMGGLVGRKKMGKALSTKVAEVWGES